MTTARWLILAVLLAPLPATALDDPPCLSQSEVKGGHPRYHIVDGRKCWHASPSPAAEPALDKPTSAPPTAAANEVDVNPYGDPAWEESTTGTASRKPRRTKPGGVGGPLILSPSSAYSR
jgi:hypothetical protein